MSVSDSCLEHDPALDCKAAIKSFFNMKTGEQENLTVNLTPNQLANRWQMHPESIRRMARQRRLESFIIAGRRLFPLGEVEKVEREGRISRKVIA